MNKRFMNTKLTLKKILKNILDRYDDANKAKIVKEKGVINSERKQ